MPVKDFTPPLPEPLNDGWQLWATQCNRSVKTGDIVTVVLAACQPGRDPDPKEIEHFDLTSAATRTPFVEQFAATSGLTPEVIESALKRLYGRVVLAMRTAQPTTPVVYYAEDGQGLWLVRPDERGETRTHLTNFRAQIVADIVEDDGTTTTLRFFEVEATQGEVTGRARLSAKDFQAMLWVADTLGPKARVFPGLQGTRPRRHPGALGGD